MTLLMFDGRGMFYTVCWCLGVPWFQTLGIFYLGTKDSSLPEACSWGFLVTPSLGHVHSLRLRMCTGILMQTLLGRWGTQHAQRIHGKHMYTWKHGMHIDTGVHVQTYVDFHLAYCGFSKLTFFPFSKCDPAFSLC